MKTVILAGGLGTRIAEESAVRPKPMVEIGGKPVLWHLMKIYSGHGLNDVDIGSGIEFHKAHGRLATMTATQPPGRFGALEFDGATVSRFLEKPQGDGGWINGGFFVLSPKVLDLIEGDETIWERG